MSDEKRGLSLDLYSGLAPEPEPRTTRPDAERPRAEAPQDWVRVLWQAFPPAVQQRYAPVQVAGEGGMGIVLEAHDTLLDRRVAVKGPRDPERVLPEWRERLAREARLHARLAHPNILPIHDAWTDARGLPWCAMLFVPSGHGRFPTLAAWLAELAARPGPRPVALLLDVFLQICRGVAHAHAAGIVHRDLKPENVLLGDSGEALVADWGVAAPLPVDAHELVGTPGYAAPEQLGQLGPPTANERSDVYSLGVMLAELVAGPRVPRELVQIAARATARDPAARFASVAALQAAVQTYLEGGLVEGLRYSLAERVVRWCRAHPAAAVALAAAAMLPVMFFAGQRRKLAEAYMNLAESHAGWATAEYTQGHRDEAQLYAALAYRSREDSGRRREFRDRHVAGIFATRSLPGPLLWTGDIGEPEGTSRGVIFLHFQGNRRLTAVTPSGRALDLNLEAPVTVAETALGLTARWQVAGDRDAERIVANSPEPPCRVFRRTRGGWVNDGDLPPTSGPAALSPDGRLVALAEERASVRLLGWPGARPLGELAFPSDHLMADRFSPDGRRLAVADATGRAWIFDVASRQLTCTCTSTGTVVLDLQFSPDGRWLAGVGGEPALWVWDATTGARSPAFNVVHPKADYVAAFSPDGRWLATGGQDFKVRVWDLSSGQDAARASEPIELSGHTNGILSLAFAPDSRTLASGSQDGTIRIWDVLAMMDRRRRVPTTNVRPPRMALAQDGRALAFSGPGARITVVGVPSLEPRESRELPAAPQAVGLDLQGHPLAAWCEGDRLWLHDATRDRAPVLAPVDPGAQPAFSPDGRYLAAARPGGRFALVDTASGHLAVEGAAPPGGAQAFGFWRSTLAVGGTSDVWLYEHRAGALSAGPRFASLVNQKIQALAFDGSGRWLGVGSDDSTAHVLDLSTGRDTRKIQQVGPVRSLVLSPAHDRAVIGGPVCLSGVRLSDGGLLTELQIPDEPVWALALDPSERYLACLRNGEPLLWDLDATADPEARIREIAADSLFALTPDGERIRTPPLAQARRVHWPPDR